MKLDLMKKLCSLEMPKLYQILIKFLHRKGYKKIYHYSDFIMAEGEIPVCLIAHMDTVFDFVHDIDDFFYDAEQQLLWAPSGSGYDDRAGIYAIIELVERGCRPHIIFTNEEEKGAIGSRNLIAKFPECPFDCKMLIQLDRMGYNDAVFYDCDNPDFTQYITSFGFEEQEGTFSDISILAPAWKIAAVNLSIGYLDEHTWNERLFCSWCDRTIDCVEEILKQASSAQYYKYIARKYNYKIYSKNYCAICGKLFTSYKEAKFYKEGNYHYCVCRDCEKIYNMYNESPSEKDYKEFLPFD